MNFSLTKSLQILERTPDVLYMLLHDVSTEWTKSNEGEGTWSVFDIVGHLIHGEKTDWIVRAEIILSDRSNKMFEPFDRFAQYETSKDKTLEHLLIEFQRARRANLDTLGGWELTEEDLGKRGVHPSFGEVTLRQLLATWVAHDLNHIGQIARVMAKQYREEVGPWINYLGILK